MKRRRARKEERVLKLYQQHQLSTSYLNSFDPLFVHQLVLIFHQFDFFTQVDNLCLKGFGLSMGEKQRDEKQVRFTC